MPYKDPGKAAAYRSVNKLLRYLTDPEYKAKALANAKEWRQKNPDKVHRQYRKRQLSFAGWTPEGYDASFVKQQGACAICGAKPEGNLCADHKHTDPPIPRKLLCHNCNAGLGQFKDNPELLEKAAQYLREFM